MKKLLILSHFLFLIPYFLFAQNVGIGTSSPSSKLHVNSGAVLFDGTAGSTPVSGAGARLMWIPAKVAFRAGSVVGAEWDDTNIGQNSFATGYGNTASGNYSTAIGSISVASGDYSTSIGPFNNVPGLGSVAMGFQNLSSGTYATAIGHRNFATGSTSVAMGYFAMSSGIYSTSTGMYVMSKSYGGFVTGLYNDSTNAADASGINSLNRVFQVGNGTAYNVRSNAMTILQNGNTGIGTVTPQALLHVKTGAILFDSTIGSTPVNGAGTRMMWIPAKAAFRAGRVTSNQWDNDTIGTYSVAVGYNTKALGFISTALGEYTTASGSSSIAMGYTTIASGFASTTMGNNTTASGSNSTAMGYSTTASGVNSIAMGSTTIASGSSSIAMGFSTTASGGYSTAMGSGTTASGLYSAARGYGTTASGYASTAMGISVQSKSYGSLAIGVFSDSTNAANPTGIDQNNRLFQIGNGTGYFSRSNAMTVLQNGNVGIGTVTPQALLHVKTGAVLFDSTIGTTPASGAGTRMMWIPAKAAFRAGYVASNQWDDYNIGTYSTAFGYNTTASEDYSTAMGRLTTASGSVSTAMGNFTSASGHYSTAMGFLTIASGLYSTAMGYSSNASGYVSVAIGDNLSSKSYAGLVIGTFNDSTNAASAAFTNQNNRLFQIGNGLTDNARKNAMTVLQNGNVGICELVPLTKLHVSGSGSSNQILLEDTLNAKMLRISNDGGGNGPYIGTTSNHNFSLVSNNTVKAIITSGGTIDVKNNLTVQNGKGIIRSSDGTQQKKLTTTVTINGSFLAGQTRTFPVTWPESFGGIPDAFVGNMTTGAGGWAEVVLTITDVTSTGANIYAYNATTISVIPNYTMKIIAIGPQ